MSPGTYDSFQVESLLSGDDDQDAECLDNILSNLKTILKTRSSLATMLHFNIKEKGENEERRRRGLLDFVGPDDETLSVLQRNHDSWMSRPSSFWVRPTPPNLAELPPQAQISTLTRRLACILLLEFEAEHKDILLRPPEIIESLSSFLAYDPKRIERAITNMVDAGSRWRNLERALGLGAVMVLGTKYPDSTWCKTLPKNGVKFDEIVNHLRQTSLPAWAERYAELRQAVMTAQLACFRRLSQR